MKLSSPAFTNGGDIPVQFTGEGEDRSPPLKWSNIPKDCKEFVLICEDPDAPMRPEKEHPFVHWVIYNISPSVTYLPEGLDSKERLEVPIRADQGKNSFGNIGYGGPMPPVGHGIHHYLFKIYALNTELAVPPGAKKSDILHAMQGHILDAAQMLGKYKRESLDRTA